MRKVINITICTLIYSFSIFNLLNVARTINSDLFTSLFAGWALAMVLHYFNSK